MLVDAAPVVPPPIPPVALIADADQAAALIHPERRRLLEALAEPDSASGLARRFRMPRQRLNYHLRELERVRLLDLIEQRRKGNCIERVVRATARTYVISPAVLGAIGTTPADAADRFSAVHLAGAAARLIRDLSRAIAGAASGGKRVATLTLDAEIRFRSAAERARFADELASATAELVAKYHDDYAPNGRRFRLLTGVYPHLADTLLRQGSGGQASPASAAKEDR